MEQLSLAQMNVAFDMAEAAVKNGGRAGAMTTLDAAITQYEATGDVLNALIAREARDIVAVLIDQDGQLIDADDDDDHWEAELEEYDEAPDSAFQNEYDDQWGDPLEYTYAEGY